MREPGYDKVNPIARACLENALTHAKEVLADVHSDQDTVNEAWAALVCGVHYLSMTSDTSILESLVEQAEKVEAELDQYRGDKEAFQNALYAARVVLVDDTALDARITAATEALEAAMSALSRIPESLDLSMLQLMIETPQLVDLDKYVEDGKAEFNADLISAVAVQEEPESQEQIDQATIDLEDACLALRLKADESLLQELRDFVSAVEAADLSLYSPSVRVQIEECKVLVMNALSAHDSGEQELDQTSAAKLAQTDRKGMDLLEQITKPADSSA